MKYYVGMDHGTTAVSFEILDENKNEVGYINLPRDKLAKGEVSFKESISEIINIEDIDLLVMCYAMGDGISEITPISEVTNRGIRSIHGAGKITGGGSSVYSEIEELNIPTYLVPGMHRNSTFLDPRFRASYSHMASSEKVTLSYYAYKTLGLDNMIVCDLSSNSVCILVENGRFTGAIDACLGAMGFIHGPLDLDMIRDIDEGKQSANACFSHAGISKIAKINTNVVNVKDEIIKKYVMNDSDAKLAIESLVMSIIMEVYGLYGIAQKPIDAIVLTGSAGVMKTPIDINGMLKDKLENLACIYTLTKKSGAIGAALMAYDIKKSGVDEIMGIKVIKSTL